MTESELLALFDVHDRLVKSCVSGDISVQQFADHYDNFPESFALDGRGASDGEKALLERHKDRVRFHQGVAECVRGLRTDVGLTMPGFRKAGVGPGEAFVRLQEFCKAWPKKPPA